MLSPTAHAARGGRRRHRRADPDNPLEYVKPERLRAAMGQLNPRQIAKAAKMSNKTLYGLLGGRTERLHRKPVQALARVMGVPWEWLAGRLVYLPNVRPAWRDRWMVMLGALFDLKAFLASPPRDRTSSAPWLRRGRLQSRVASVIELMRGEREKPPRFDADAPNERIRPLLNQLQQVAAVASKRMPTVSERKSAIEAIEAFVGARAVTPSATTYGMPSEAQLAEFRLRGVCIAAWKRDAARHSGFIERVVELDYYSPAEYRREPVKSLGVLWKALDYLLVPENWHGKLCPGAKPLTAEDWNAQTRAIATWLEAVLEPWLRGETRLDSRLLLLLTRFVAPRSEPQYSRRQSALK